MQAYLYNSHDIPLILTIGQCLLFAVILLLTRDRPGTGNGILALLLFAFGLHALDTLSYWNENLRVLSAKHLGIGFFWIFEWVPMAQGPLVYVYVKTRLTGRDSHWRDESIHLVPIAIFIFAEVMFILSMGHERLYGGIQDWTLWYSSPIAGLLQWAGRVSALAYGVMAWRFLLMSEVRLKESYSNAALAEPDWLRVLIFGFLGLWIWTALVTLTGHGQLELVIINQVMGIAFNYLVFAFISSMLFYGLLHSHLVAKLPDALPRVGGNAQGVGRLQDQAANQLLKSLTCDKLYMDPELTLGQLAAAADMSERQASELINTHLGKNFFELVNRTRVEKAKHLLRTTTVPVQQVLDNSGFNSKATFNRIFKRYQQMTPSEYRQQIKLDQCASQD